ncbi:MAG: type I glyceraldehyde-3-phosphate dehydrogenase [Candidatus Bathyarchaeia archaeon]
MKRIAINGLGRIGRLVLRQHLSDPPVDVEIVAANDLTPLDELAYLIRYDSVHGRAPVPIRSESDNLRIGTQRLTMLREEDPAKLPWRTLGVDIVLECTGRFRSREDSARHLTAGASKVIISAPSDSADLTVVMGVNEEKYDAKKHHVLSSASCTTNSLAPVAKILNEAFGIEYLMLTTIHAYTSSQKLVDMTARKRRRGRAAAVSLVPTSTGAADATALVMPELKGKMDAIAVRVPVADGSLSDIVAHLGKDVSVERLNATFREAATGKLKGILDYSEDEIVSVDIIGDPHSGIIDGPSTRVLMNRAAKVLVWYDNEYAYARRMLDLASYIASK